MGTDKGKKLLTALWRRYGQPVTFLVAGMAIGLWVVTLFNASEPTDRPTVTRTPAMAAADALTCPPGLWRRVQVLGREDGFDRSDSEPAIMSAPSREVSRSLASLKYARQLDGFRDWDETGADKSLYHQMEIPSRLETGWIVARILTGPGSDNDSIGLYRPLPGRTTGARMAELMSRLYNHQTPQPALSDGSEILVIPFDDLRTAPPPSPAFPDLLDPDDSNPQADVLIADFKVAEDTAADVAIIVTCERPATPMGVTFTSSTAWVDSHDVYSFSCEAFAQRPSCSPRLGDTPCTESRPVACYLEGERRIPDALGPDSGLAGQYFLGGEIRFTESVRGEALESVGEVNAICRDRFGPDWRVVDFHEAGGQMIFVATPLEDGVNAWVDERDNGLSCWRDRG